MRDSRSNILNQPSRSPLTLSHSLGSLLILAKQPQVPSTDLPKTWLSTRIYPSLFSLSHTSDYSQLDSEHQLTEQQSQSSATEQVS